MTSRGDRGAAAVEFALVVPLLIGILLAIVDFGVWFTDSVGVKDGTRSGARAGVVTDFGNDPDCVGTPTAKTACVTKERIGIIGGPIAVRVVASGNQWVEGRQLLVCAAVKEAGMTGLTPLPKDGVLRAKTKMRIEVTAATPAVPPYADSDPSGDDWSWCT
jgi:hypothetical protein